MKLITIFFSLFLTSFIECYEPLRDNYHVQHTQTHLCLPYLDNTSHTYNIPPSFRQKSYVQRKYYIKDLSISQKLAAIQNLMRYFAPAYANPIDIPYTFPVSIPLITDQTSSIASPIITEPPPTSPLSQESDITSLEDELFIQKQCPEWDKHTDILDARSNALEQVKNGDDENTTQNYSIAEKANRYCKKYDIESETLRCCSGNILQQTIHQEFVTITHESAKIWHKSTFPKPLGKLIHTLADFTFAGISYNNNNEIRNALQLANTCWMILDCIQAAGEGLLDGTKHLINDITHPIRTTQNIAESAAICGYYIGKIAVEIAELGYITITETPDKTYKKLDAWKQNFSLIYNTIQEKRASLKTRDIIKETVSLGLQCYAAPKVLHGLGKLFKHAERYATTFAKNISAIKKTNALTTPEGIIVGIADNVTACMKSVQLQSIDSFVPVFIKENRVPRDIETILHHPLFKKTKIPPVKGAQVYTKDNLFYHRDTFHKGKGAHLEVYNRKGLHLGEADPITGQLIENTADKRKKLFK